MYWAISINKPTKPIVIKLMNNGLSKLSNVKIM